jgi:hypothetical protein
MATLRSEGERRHYEQKVPETGELKTNVAIGATEGTDTNPTRLSLCGLRPIEHPMVISVHS